MIDFKFDSKGRVQYDGDLTKALVKVSDVTDDFIIVTIPILHYGSYKLPLDRIQKPKIGMRYHAVIDQKNPENPIW